MLVSSSFFVCLFVCSTSGGCMMMDLLESYYSSESDCESEENSKSNLIDTGLLNRPLLDKYHIKPTVNPDRTASYHLMKTRFWTSFIYIDWRLTSKDRQILTQYVNQCNSRYSVYGVEFKPLFYSDLGTPQNLHVSLSPNLKFSNEDERDRFFNILQNNLMLKGSKLFGNCVSRKGSISIPLERQPKLLKAPGSSATFLTFPIDKTILANYVKPLFNEIANLWNSMDGILKFSQPDIPVNESFIDKAHVSIAKTWSTIPPDTISSLLQPLDTTLLIPANHRIQYDRNRESLTLKIPLS